MSNSQPRWAIFSGSVISPVDNPDAALLRALGWDLAQRGHQATFYEERGNPHMRALLERAGAQALATFRRSHPEITYRTLDPRSGPALVESLVQLLATVDIALVQRHTPIDVSRWLGRLTRQHLQTYLLDTGLGKHLSDDAIEALEPANFSGVLVVNDELAERYARWTAPDRLHRIGPLPEEINAGSASPTQLQEAASSLTDELLAIFVRDRTRIHGFGHTNGHVS